MGWLGESLLRGQSLKPQKLEVVRCLRGSPPSLGCCSRLFSLFSNVYPSVHPHTQPLVSLRASPGSSLPLPATGTPPAWSPEPVVSCRSEVVFPSKQAPGGCPEGRAERRQKPTPCHPHRGDLVTYREKGVPERETERTDQKKRTARLQREKPRGKSVLKRNGRQRPRQAG